MSVKEKIYDVLSDEETLIEMNKKELAQYEAEKASSKLEEEKRLADELTKASAKSALLEKLGITEDEAKLLLS
jgi:hypothetical protein